MIKNNLERQLAIPFKRDRRVQQTLFNYNISFDELIIPESDDKKVKVYENLIRHYSKHCYHCVDAIDINNVSERSDFMNIAIGYSLLVTHYKNKLKDLRRKANE